MKPRADWSMPMAPALFVRIDARRPASWLALAAGAWWGWWLAPAAAVGDALPDVACLLFGWVAAVAAIGDPPIDLCGVGGSGRPGRVAMVSWAALRAAWPLLGFAVVAAATGPERAVATVSVAAVGATLAAASWAAVRRLGLGAADAASVALLMSAAAGGVAVQVRTAPLAAIVAVLVLACLVLWLVRISLDAENDLSAEDRGRAERPGESLRRGPLPHVGPLRRNVTRIAMAASLAGMAVWLVLHADRGSVGDAVSTTWAARLWQLSSAAWFVGLAVPQAALQDGGAGSDGWRLLWRSAAAGRPGSRVGRMLRPGAARFAAGVAVEHAAILGWPPLIAALLSVPRFAQASPPLAIVLTLALAAAAVVLVACLAEAVGAAPETTCAVLLWLAASAFATEIPFGATFRAAGLSPPRPPSLSNLRSSERFAGGLGDLQLSRQGLPGTLMACVEKPRAEAR